jgi:hypothetical protein
MDCADLCRDLGEDCVDATAEENSTWYTVCGRAHSDYPLYVAATAAVCGLATIFYTLLLTFSGSGAAPVVLVEKRKKRRKEA